MQRHGHQPAGADRPVPPSPARHDGVGHARADQRGEQRLAQRREHAAVNERRGHAAEAVVDRLGVVVDALDQREAEADHAPVDDPVVGAVDFLRPPQQQPHQDGALEGLLRHGHADDRRGGRGSEAAGTQRGGRDQMPARDGAGQPDHRGGARSPQEDEDQAAGRLRLQPVQVKHAGQQRRDGQQGQG